VHGPILKPAMIEKRWLAVFTVTCTFGVAVKLDLFQLHVHSVIPCLCSLPIEPSPEDLQLGDFTIVQADWHSKIWQKIYWSVVSHIQWRSQEVCSGGPVTWRASDCSFPLFSTSWNWHKAPAKNLGKFVSGGAWLLWPHSGCATVLISHWGDLKLC